MIVQASPPPSPPKRHLSGKIIPSPLKPGIYRIKNAQFNMNLHPQKRGVFLDIATTCDEPEKHVWKVKPWNGQPGIYSIRYRNTKVLANCTDTDEGNFQVVKDGTTVTGRPNPSLFEISPWHDVENCYTVKVAYHESDLFWGLADDQIGTPVKLEKSKATSRCQWFFEAIEMPNKTTGKRSLSGGSEGPSTVRVVSDAEDAELNEPPRKVAKTMSPRIPPNRALTVVSDTDGEETIAPFKVERTISPGIPPDDASTIVGDTEDGEMTGLLRTRNSIDGMAPIPNGQRNMVSQLMPPLKPHIKGEFVPTGRYRIQNVRWLNYLELPDPNDASEVVSAVGENKTTQLWKVVDLENGKHSIENEGSANYANAGFRAQKGSAVVGRSNLQQFKITECRVKGIYTIRPTDVQLYWGLTDDELGLPVRLDAIPNTEINQWFFIPLD